MHGMKWHRGPGWTMFEALSSFLFLGSHNDKKGGHVNTPFTFRASDIPVEDIAVELDGLSSFQDELLQSVEPFLISTPNQETHHKHKKKGSLRFLTGCKHTRSMELRHSLERMVTYHVASFMLSLLLSFQLSRGLLFLGVLSRAVSVGTLGLSFLY